MFLTSLYFLLTLLLLVSVHEYGHFQVARWFGVKVLRFSFGFGPVLARWRDRKGTEYVCSLFPLGGYVKMLDESEEQVAEHLRHLAFNNQPIGVRAAIVLAGPLSNFFFAFVALWMVWVIGMHSLAPIVHSVQASSIAAHAGLMPEDELIALNKTKISSWQDFQYAMMPLMGSRETAQLTVKSLLNGYQRQLSLPLSNWQLDSKKPDLLKSLGIAPFIPAVPPVVAEVVPNSPAAKAGLQHADELLAVDGKPFKDWLFLVDYVRVRPNKQVTLIIKRQGRVQPVKVHTGSQNDRGKILGFLGLRSEKVSWPGHWLRMQRQNPLEALGTAFKQTLQLTRTTFILMARLVTGKLGLNSISGPVGIAQGAGNSGRAGLPFYLFFLALVSISLGALNLLPIPMLDGGHLLYYIFEVVRGKPLSDRVKSVGTYLGLFVLAVLMLVALTNDLSRLIG